jgi:acetyl esterase
MLIGMSSNDYAQLDPELQHVLRSMYETDLMQWDGLDAMAVRARFTGIKPTVTTPAIARVESVDVPGPAGPVPCRLYHPEPGTRLPLLVWFHGGGWVLGTLDGEEGTARLLASHGRMAVLTVDYRLAPEHRFPAAIDDAVACFDWAVAHADQLAATVVGVGGCSAGGNLAAVVSMQRAATAIDGGAASPVHQLLVYPITDCDDDRASMASFGSGLILHREHMQWFWDQYVPDPLERANWRVSPLRGAMSTGIAPATVLLAECDPLVDEGRAYAEALQRAGVPVQMEVGRGLTHGFVGMCRKVEVAQTLFLKTIDAVSVAMRAVQG